jgi:hypothetical protein
LCAFDENLHEHPGNDLARDAAPKSDALRASRKLHVPPRSIRRLELSGRFKSGWAVGRQVTITGSKDSSTLLTEMEAGFLFPIRKATTPQPYETIYDYHCPIFAAVAPEQAKQTYPAERHKLNQKATPGPADIIAGGEPINSRSEC